jgi:hypothetical protein
MFLTSIYIINIKIIQMLEKSQNTRKKIKVVYSHTVRDDNYNWVCSLGPTFPNLFFHIIQMNNLSQIYRWIFIVHRSCFFTFQFLPPLVNFLYYYIYFGFFFFFFCYPWNQTQALHILLYHWATSPEHFKTPFHSPFPFLFGVLSFVLLRRKYLR